MRRMLLVLGLICLFGTSVKGDEVADVLRNESVRRDLRVPFKDLHLLLDGGTQHVLMPQEEFDDLWARAQIESEEYPPRPAVMNVAEYTIRIEQDRALIEGDLTVDVLAKGLHVIPLPLSGVGLQSARLDDRGAAMGCDATGALTLIVEGKGMHQLSLRAVAPLQTSAARQILQIRLPVAGAARIRMTAPGDVEMKSGADVVSRVYDDERSETRFELLASRNEMNLVMTLNSRLQKRDRVVVARSVIVDVVTAAHESLHATVSLDILHRALDRFEFSVPAGFEITSVESPDLARWALRDDEAVRVLEVILRKERRGTVVFGIVGSRSDSTLDEWTYPRLEPRGVVGHVAVIGILAEDRITARDMEPRGLIHLDRAVLLQAMPLTATEVDRGGIRLRPLAAYYAPNSDYALSATLVKRPLRRHVTTHTQLRIGRDELMAWGGLTVEAFEEALFELDLTVPHSWDVYWMATGNGDDLAFDRYPMDPGRDRLHVRLPGKIEPGSTRSLLYRARHVPLGWLEEWDVQEIAFPVFALAGADRDIGAITVSTEGDLEIRPSKLENLSPLDASEQARFGIERGEGTLGYRYDAKDYRATLTVTKRTPRITAETYSFYLIEQEVMKVRHEIIYQVEEARTRNVEFSLPTTTPQLLTVRGLNGTQVKEYLSEDHGKYRRWRVDLAEARSGAIHVEVSYPVPLPGGDVEMFVPPVVRAEGVVYQSGLVAVEGSADLDLRVLTHPRPVDIGELAEAEYVPGKRLLGAYGFVGEPNPIELSITRPRGAPLPPVIIERAEVTSASSSWGISQISARYRLRSRVSFLEVRLPEGATLWSARVDGRPLLPQQHESRILLSLPQNHPAHLYDLVLVYESPIRRLGMLGRIQIHAPELYVTHDDQDEVGVPVSDLRWQLILPEGYRIQSSGGTVSPADRSAPMLAAVRVGGWLHQFAGGVDSENGLIGLLVAPFVSSMDRGLRMYESVEFGSRLGGTDESMQSFDDMVMAPEKEVGQRMRSDAPSAPPATQSVPKESDEYAPSRTRLRTKGKVAWALQGARSLDIKLSKLGPKSSYHSLGVAPSLDVSVIQRRRQDAMVSAAALAVIVGGLGLVTATVRRKAVYMIAILFLSTLLAVLPGMSSWVKACNSAFYAACLLGPFYLGVHVVMVCWGWLKRIGLRLLRPRVAVVLVLGCSAMGAVEEAKAADQPDPPPISVPRDVFILPYSSEQEGTPKPHHLLVPYQTFEELWNQVDPQDVAGETNFMTPYAWAGAVYEAELSDDDVFVVSGKLEIEVFTEKSFDIPFTLEGGVLARAALDGKPARIRVRRPNPVARESQQFQQFAQQGVQPLEVSLAMLGKGGHRLEFEVRIPLSRRGGWRVAHAMLPYASAASLEVAVPEAGTEIHMSGIQDQRRYETTKADERIRTVLGLEGRLHIEWRPEVGEGQTDKSLTAESYGVFDVQEDRLGLTWSMDIRFRNGERDAFEVNLPEGYIVQAVTGANVRGWALHESNPRVLIQLLKPATKQERIVVKLLAPGLGLAETTESLTVPSVALEGAIRHTGRIVIRRSPLLDLRVRGTKGVQRINLTELDRARMAITGLAENPLGLDPLHMYEFVVLPFRLDYDAVTLAVEMEAVVQTIVRLAERERLLESRVELDIRNRPIYQMEVNIPAEMTINELHAPGMADWTVIDTQIGRRLTVYFSAGIQGNVSVVLRGRLGETEARREVPVPRIWIEGVEHQRGEIAVQSDPAYDVIARELVNVEKVLITRISGWLKEAQRPHTRVALAYDHSDLGGVLHLEPRKSVVHAFTVSNARVTDRAIEETILINFTILHAGLRTVEFELPRALADARIRVPYLRQKTVTPLPERDAVLVRLDLQSAVMNQLVVLVEHDRVLDSMSQSVRLPVVRTGRVDARFVAVESAGRDEVVLDATEGMDPLSRQQKEWAKVSPILQGGTTRAFLVTPDAESPSLAFHIKQRTTVETAGARIGLARATVILDGQATFRAQQVYHVDNRTEQFLAIDLPAETHLWTAKVAGDYVKPAMPDKSDSQRLHIPLIKTEAGDLDYEVVLKYGGALPALKSFRRVRFPLIEAVNIGVELTQVELRLPRTHHWPWFGGTLRRLTDEGDFEAGLLSYRNKMMERLTQTLQYGNVFSQSRAVKNLRSLSGEQHKLAEGYASSYSRNSEVSDQIQTARKLTAEANQKLGQVQRMDTNEQAMDNRASTLAYFDSQSNDFSANLLRQADSNWDTQMLEMKGNQTLESQSNLEKLQWLESNALVAGGKDMDGERKAEVTTGLYGVEQRGAVDRSRELQTQLKQMDAVRKNKGSPAAIESARGKSRRSQQDLAVRYQQRLEEQVGLADEERAMEEMEIARGRNAFQFGADKKQDVGEVRSPLVSHEHHAKRSDGDRKVGDDAFEGRWRAEGSKGATGLASLDVEFPEFNSKRWERARFTTPRGEVDVNGMSVPRHVIEGAKRVLMVLISFGLVWLAVRWSQGRTLSAPHRVWVSNLTIISGVVGLLFGIYPWASLVAILIGFVAKRRARYAMIG